MWVIIILLTISLILIVKFTKQDIAEYYGICKKTLAKWVLHFATDDLREKWKTKRKFSYFETEELLKILGSIDVSKPLNKGEILERCYSDYLTISQSNSRGKEFTGISEYAYLNMDIFPPKYSLRLIAHLGE